MVPTSVIALFCDDIREEKAGPLTLVGVLPDNIKVPAVPADQGNTDGAMLVRVLPRLGIYIRINFDASADLGPITVKVTMPDGEEVHNSAIEEATVTRARSTREKGNLLAGIVQRLQFGGLSLKQLGRITVAVTIGAQTYIAGSLNFVSDDIAP